MKINKKIAFLFPGQGSQYIGMGKSFYDKYDFVRDLFNEASEVLDYDIANLCFEGPFDKLSKAENIQSAMLTVSVASYKVYMFEIGVRPDYLAGHSFGELSALVAAEAIDFKDAIHIARCEGRFAVEATKGRNTAMSVIKNINKKDLEKICENNSKKTSVNIGVVNTESQFTISGEEKNIIEVEKEVIKLRGDYSRLNTTAPFHSLLLKSAIPKLKNELKKIKKNKPIYPILSSVTNKIYKNSDDIVDNISKSYTESVQWLSVFKSLIKRNIDIFVEIGPQKVLSNLAKDINNNINIYSFGGEKDIDEIKNVFCVNRQKKEKLIIKLLKIIVCTKNNCIDNDVYQRDVSNSYEIINNILLKSEEENSEVLISDIKNILDIFEKILNAKKIDEKEKNKILKEIIENNYFLSKI